MEYEGDSKINQSWSPWNNPKEHGKGNWGTGDPEKWGHSDHSTLKISRALESWEDLHSLKFQRKTPISTGMKTYIIIIIITPWEFFTSVLADIIIMIIQRRIDYSS